MPASVQVISPVLGMGNRLDLELVASILEESDFDVTRYAMTDRRKVARIRRAAGTFLRRSRRFDLNIFLAPIFPECLPLARKNVWIPNPEGFTPYLRKWMPSIDLVLAKTRMTERIFRKLGLPTEYTGFTSRDHFEKQDKRDYTRFFHASSTPCKGTKRMIDVWKNHPEWPEVIIVDPNNDPYIASSGRPNIRISKYLEAAEFYRLQNTIGFHMCPSEAEGYGHYMMEAMSCRAVTFTTNGPPMNELVDSSRGILLDRLDETPEFGLSHRYFFKPESMEEQVTRALKLDPAALEEIGSSARAFFLENDRLFRKSFPELIRSICARPK